MKNSAKRPLSALLSQTLVAFTIELDNEFQRRMAESAYPGAGLSLVVWLTLMRFLRKDGVSAEDLIGKAIQSPERVKFMLGCLERWRFIRLKSNPPTADGVRDGWGSGRGIRSEWIVQLTSKGAKAVMIWPPLLDEIEERWRKRFGAEVILQLRETLRSLTGQGDSNLPSLLGRALLEFKKEFDREAPERLELSANILRVLSKAGTPEKDISYLTGGSRETSGVGWEVKRYVIAEPAPKANQGKVVRLTPLGLKAQEAYFRLVDVIERRWQTRFGKKKIIQLRRALEELFESREGERPLIMAGLVPPSGVIRAGCQLPALGRTDIGAAARKRARDLVLQTEAFISDPAARLPHYPLWDMNRGFGP